MIFLIYQPPPSYSLISLTIFSLYHAQSQVVHSALWLLLLVLMLFQLSVDWFKRNFTILFKTILMHRLAASCSLQISVVVLIEFRKIKYIIGSKLQLHTCMCHGTRTRLCVQNNFSESVIEHTHMHFVIKNNNICVSKCSFVNCCTIDAVGYDIWIQDHLLMNLLSSFFNRNFSFQLISWNRSTKWLILIIFKLTLLSAHKHIH